MASHDSQVAMAAWRDLMAMRRLMCEQDLLEELASLDELGDGAVSWRLCLVRAYCCIAYMIQIRKLRSGPHLSQQRLDNYLKLYRSRDLRILAAMGKLSTAQLLGHDFNGEPTPACPPMDTPNTSDSTFDVSLGLYIMHNGPWVTSLFMGDKAINLPSPIAPQPSPETVAAMASSRQLPPACNQRPLKHQEIILLPALSGSRESTGTDPVRAGAAVAHNQSSYVMTSNENAVKEGDWVPYHLEGNFASSRFYRSVVDHFDQMSMKARIDHMALDWFKATPVYFQQYIYGNGSCAGPPHLLHNIHKLFKEAGLKTAWLPVDQRGHLLDALNRVQSIMIDAQVGVSFFSLHLISQLPDSNPLFAASVLVKEEVTANQQSGGGPLVQLSQYCHPCYPFVCLYAAKVKKPRSKQHKAFLASIWETQLQLPVMDEKELAEAVSAGRVEQPELDFSTITSGKRKRGCR